MEFRDNQGKFSFPGETRDRRSKSKTVLGVSGRLAHMLHALGFSSFIWVSSNFQFKLESCWKFSLLFIFNLIRRVCIAKPWPCSWCNYCLSNVQPFGWLFWYVMIRWGDISISKFAVVMGYNCYAISFHQPEAVPKVIHYSCSASLNETSHLYRFVV